MVRRFAAGGLVAGVVLAGLLAGCGSSGKPTPTSKPTAGPFGQVARKQARQLLNQLVLPSGSQPLRVAPRGDGGLLSQAQSTPGARQLIDLHRIWRVRRTLSSTASFVEGHLPRDAHGEVIGGVAGGAGIPDNRDDSYSLPNSGRIFIRWLSLVFVSLPYGWTGIRADAQIGRGPLTHGPPS